MIAHAKHPALAMLVGALWLTAADPSLAGSPGTNREQFASLLANPKNVELLRHLEHQLARINRVDKQLQQQQNALTGKVTGQSFNPFLAQLAQLDSKFAIQSQRIAARLQSLNNLANTPGVNLKAIDRLRNELTRLDATVMTQLTTIQRVERGSATPFAPGGF